MRTLLIYPRWTGRLRSSGPFQPDAFARRLRTHLQRWAVLYLVCAAGAIFFHAHYAFGLNATPSLPYRLFLIHKGERPRRGDFVAFRWAGGGPYPAGVTFIKVLAGVPGDEVTRDAQGFHVNGIPVGTPKPLGRQGQPLEPGPTGRLPEGSYYVEAPHPDSLDSRYGLTGWIHDSQIIGRARALF
jgi:conjugal transfer pilin signal peptidase TrbI